jgi:lysophospholipase L1-like esterase
VLAGFRVGPSVGPVNHTYRLATALLVALLAALGALVGAPAAAADPRPPAVVVLGDSAASGDGAGAYEAGTRGEGGNWCHRSARAYVHRTGLAAESVNLACSGAKAADVGFGAGTHYTEGSQAARLVEVARRYRVATVVVQLGANDDAALLGTGIACIAAFLDPSVRPCRDTVGPLLPQRMAATGRAVEAAVRDVRQAMRQAGYAEGGYGLVLVSYAAPVTERMVPLSPAQGCPYGRADAAWGRTVLFPAVSAALAGVAGQTGARFLDLVRATEGREACSRVVPGQEWQRRITVDPEAFVHGGMDAVGYHLAQESFHPNAAAHAELGRCLGAFVHSGDRAAACVPGADGRLRLERGATTATPA